LFTLGSFPGPADSIGRLFADRGYVFLFLFPRGTGLSVSQGANSSDLLAKESARHGLEARDRLYVELLQTDHLHDGIAALALLRALPDVDSLQVAAAGHSGGGSLALLLAERDKGLRAVVNFAGAARNWDRSPWLRTRLRDAVRGGAAPVMMVYAANDASLAPAKVLAAEMSRQGRPHRVRIYPPFGRTTDEGHRFVFLSPASWANEVFAFLDEHMRR
jgi:dienelactone hydrolase